MCCSDSYAWDILRMHITRVVSVLLMTGVAAMSFTPTQFFDNLVD